MAKDILVKGEARNGISRIFAQLADGSGEVPFVDADEASGGSIDGIVAIATGEFSVSAATNVHTIKHGMSVTPDAAVCIPKYWYDTVDTNGALAAVSRHAYIGIGRRTVEGATEHNNGKLDETCITDTDITFMMTTLSKFQPTYTDADGNTGAQVYLWAAVKFAEVN